MPKYAFSNILETLLFSEIYSTIHKAKRFLLPVRKPSEANTKDKSKVSVNVLPGQIYILKRKKFITAFVNILLINICKKVWLIKESKLLPKTTEAHVKT